MSSKRIQGENIQPVPQEPEQEEQKVDPEKFKKVMKVEESDEATKQHKKPLKEEEEEEDEEQVDQPAAPNASTSFSEFMSDKDQLDNVFDSESGGIRRQAAPQNESMYSSPPPGSISTEGVEVDEDTGPSQTPSQPPAPSSQADTSTGGETAGQQQPTSQQGTPSSQPTAGEAPLYEGVPEEQQPSYSHPSNEPQGQDYSDTESTSPQDQPVQESHESQQQDQQQGDQPPSKKKEEDSSLLASQPKLSDLQIKKKKKKPPSPEVKVVPYEAKPGEDKTKETKGTELQEGPEPQTEHKTPTGMPTKEEAIEAGGTGPQPQSMSGVPGGEEISGEEPFGATTPLKGKGSGNFRIMSPEEVRKQRMTSAKAKAEGEAAIEGVPVSAPEEGSAMGHKGKKKDDDEGFLEASELTASITLPISDMPLTPITPTETTPSYSKLTPEVFELFEKMGGVMTIQQNQGITTTTMVVNMPNSVFNGAEIVLDQYSTAPHSYNIQLKGSPEAVSAFRDNIARLDQAFKQGNFGFEVNLLTPAISTGKKSPHLIRRKGSAGGKGGQGGKQKGG